MTDLELFCAFFMAANILLIIPTLEYQNLIRHEERYQFH